MKIIDAKNLECPKPVILTKKALDEGYSDLKILVNNQVAKKNVLKLLDSHNSEYKVEKIDDIFEIYAFNTKTTSSSDSESNFTIFCKSENFGTGEEKLSKTLMKSFFYSLTELDQKPKHLIFMNSGIKLTLGDSPIIDILTELEKEGSTILVCGTCLDYYDASAALKVGEITNMYTATEILSRTTRIINI